MVAIHHFGKKKVYLDFEPRITKKLTSRFFNTVRIFLIPWSLKFSIDLVDYMVFCCFV